MKFRVTRLITEDINIDAVRLELPVRYEDEDMPNHYPFRNGDMWSVEVDISTGKIKNWPGGHALNLYMKVVDGGTYTLLDSGREVAQIKQDYVPHAVVPGEYGDYVALKINERGIITNWAAPTDLSDFFPYKD